MILTNENHAKFQWIFEENTKKIEFKNNKCEQTKNIFRVSAKSFLLGCFFCTMTHFCLKMQNELFFLTFGSFVYKILEKNFKHKLISTSSFSNPDYSSPRNQVVLRSSEFSLPESIRPRSRRWISNRWALGLHFYR